MSLFSRRQDPSAPPPTGAGYSVLDAQLTVRGNIETDGTLRVDGRLEGSILRADIVVLGESAAIVGDITAREVIVGGTVEGHITASARVELQATATVSGDIEAGTILIHEGSAVHGRLNVKSRSQVAASVTRRGSAPAPASPGGAGATDSAAKPMPALSGSGV